MVIEAYVHGVSTRSVDDLVEALGVGTGIGAWTWQRNAAVVAEGGKASGSDELWALCGLEVLAVRLLNASCSGDCAFELSDGGSLETRSDRTGNDKWRFRHDDLDRVFIGQ